MSEAHGSPKFRERFFDLSLDLMLVVGFDGCFRDANEVCARILGYSREELLSRPFSSLIHPEDRGISVRAFESVAQGSAGTGVENRYIRKDGGIRWIRWHAAVDSKARLVYGVGRDITEQKRLSEEFKLSEDRYRSLVEAAQDLIWSVDKKGHFTFVNRACERIYGYAPEELLGRSIIDLSATGSRELSAERFARVLEGEPVFQFETTQRRKDGSRVDLSLNSVPIHGDDGVIVGATGTASDITERKRAEERLMKQAEAIRSMATPIIQVWDGVVAMPIIGVIDSKRAAQVMEALLGEIVRLRTRFAILDLTGVEMVDTSTANYLLQMVRAVSLLGGTCIVSGIAPAIASTIVSLGIEMTSLLTFGTLQSALRHAIRESGTVSDDIGIHDGRRRAL